MIIQKTFLFFLLIIGIGISIIAGFFSISGLTTIFKGSEFSVLLMGTFLEIAKVNVSIYIHLFWKDIKKALLSYLVIALLILMSITSLGIYGYLSKSFFTSTDTSSISTKVESMNVTLEIEKSKVKTARDEIDYLNNIPREEKKQWHIYRVQKLSRDIDGYSKRIDEVNEKYITEKVKLNSLESEVGPLKYLAMIIYQDKSQDAIAKSVQIFIIFIVIVFDPLAILVILSSINGFEILKEKEKEKLKEINIHEKIIIGDKTIEEDIKIESQEDIINVEINMFEEPKVKSKKQKKIEEEKIIENIESLEKDVNPILDEIVELKTEEINESLNEEIKEELEIASMIESSKEEVLELITTGEENPELDRNILNDFNKKENKNKRKSDKKQKNILNEINPELAELSSLFDENDESMKEIIIKERPVIEINRDGEFENDMIYSIMDNIEEIENNNDKIDKMYNQTPMIGGKFNDNV